MLRRVYVLPRPFVNLGPSDKLHVQRAKVFYLYFSKGEFFDDPLK